MPYYNSVLRVGDSQNLIERLKNEWQPQIDRDTATIELLNYFPITEVPAYDLYLRCPRGSLLCFEKTTATDFSMDCYANSANSCASDFSLALRRIGSISSFVIDQVDFTREISSKWIALRKALISGGILLFLIPIVGELISETNLRIFFYLASSVTYTLTATFYYRREES
jgi:hypothetical protein